MKKIILSLIILAFTIPSVSFAHRSGCHRWHSCPPDSGSYVCGDLGYTSGCPITDTVPTPNNYDTSSSVPVVNDYFVGTPKTRVDLNSCFIVGNYSSYIYHLKGSKYIKGMVLKNKKCFSTETEARDAGFRKSKTR